MAVGNVRDFLKRYPSFPVVHFLRDIIEASDPKIVHGNIKGENVLVNDREQALLCDFGTYATHTVGALRWMAPELLAKDQYVPTMASDIYSYGMTCYEILSRQVPFESVRNNLVIVAMVVNGARPERLDWGYPDRMWTIIDRCWAQKPDDRPSTKGLLESIRKAVLQSSQRIDLEEISRYIHILQSHHHRSSFISYLAATMVTSLIMHSSLICLSLYKLYSQEARDDWAILLLLYYSIISLSFVLSYERFTSATFWFYFLFIL
jgi:serine/threonine protein kinase